MEVENELQEVSCSELEGGDDVGVERFAGLELW